MLSARCTSLLALLLAAGCLQPGKLPEGRKLFAGRDIGSLGFVPIDGAAWVAFNRQKSPATPSKGAVSDLWIAGPVDPVSLSSATAPDGLSPSGIQQRLVIANRSDRWGGVQAGDSPLTRSLFTMVDERQVTSGGAEGGLVESVGTLVRIDPQYQPNVTFENVSTFTLDSQHDSRLLYRQVPAGDETPGLFLWDGQDSRRLGDVANISLLDMEVAGSGIAYFVLGSDRVLSRLDKLTDTVQDLHANVSRFLLRPDEKYATLSLSNAGTSTTVVLDVQAGKDIALARPNPCCWLGFKDPDLFTYAQSAGAGSSAEYHTLDLTSGIDTTLVLPAPLVDLSMTMPRPQSDEVLYVDSQRHGVFFGPNQQVRRAVLQFGGDQPVRMLSPTFSRDGRYLLYLDPQPTTQTEPYPHGPLMVQDADLVNPPRQLSTPGMTVGAGQFFFIDGPPTDGGATAILVFWANVVRASSDLYFANHETGELKVAAGAIGNVTVLDYNHIFGTVNESAQDVVGDLVVKDVRGCVQDKDCRILARAVAEATQSGYPVQAGLVAYTVRGRVPSDHDGLWGTTLTLPGQDGGL